MIDFGIDENDELIRDTAARFTADHLEPNFRQFEKARNVGTGVRHAWESLGLNGLELPEEIGGSGCNTLTRSLVNETLGACDAGAMLNLDRIGAAAYPLLEMADNDTIQRWLGPILQDPDQRALLVYAPDSITFDSSTCSGMIPWVHSDSANLIVCLNRDGACIVRTGFSFAEVRGSGLRAAGASAVSFDNAPVECHWENAESAARALARARLYYASLLLGVIRQSAKFSRNYAKERIVFGKPVAHHQAMAFLMTDINTAITSCEHHIRYASIATDNFIEAAATAFAETSEQAAWIGPNGVQILGGVGFMQDYPVEKYMREARALGLLLGGADAARDDAEKHLNAYEPLLKSVL